jgi:hypothetical protein
MALNFKLAIYAIDINSIKIFEYIVIRYLFSKESFEIYSEN